MNTVGYSPEGLFKFVANLVNKFLNERIEKASERASAAAG